MRSVPIIRKLGILLVSLSVSLLFLTPVSASASDGSNWGNWGLSDFDGNWASWGHDLFNTRFNPFATEIDPANVATLQLKWAFVFPDAVSASSQPAVTGDTLYVGGWNGKFYALNPKTGQQKWSYDTAQFTGPQPVGANAVRDAPVVAAGKVFLGDLQGNVYALNARTGAQIWAKKVDPHPAARITGSPLFYKGRIFIGVSSFEAGLALDPTYPCCTFRGSMVALDAQSGGVVWKYYTITDSPQPIGTNSIGTTLYGPSGGPVWDSPAIDPLTDTLYFGTGQSYTKPTVNRTDSIIALNLRTGQERWAVQLTPNDRWNLSCNPELIGLPPGTGPNCPAPSPADQDFDFGSSPNLFVTFLNGHPRLLVGAGQKSGVYHALDAHTGEIVWQTQLGVGTPGGVGGIQWGTAWDGQRIYVATHDAHPGTLFALNPANGQILWANKNPADGCSTGGATGNPDCRLALPAATSIVPGLVFEGSWDGKMRAYNSRTGLILWSYDTVHSYIGTNGVTGQGGTMSGAGATIVDGRVYINSGYQPYPTAGMVGNVLLAFGLPSHHDD
jgi:polyvinyl alcohol dehydrogenase (cytochrome)